MPRSPAESARTALEEVRDALRELTQAVTKLERTVRSSRRKPRGRPPRTEVGFIDVASTEVESTVTKTSWSGATREEVVKVGMNQFVAYALGPNGRYEAARSQTFKPERDGVGSTVQHGGILEEFLVSLIEDGWTVTPPGTRYDDHYRSWMRAGTGAYYGAYRLLGLRRTVIE